MSTVLYLRDILELRDLDPLTGKIIGAAIDIHRALGPEK